MIEEILSYSAFTDIEFNPEKSINCQAYSVALFVSLHKQNLLDDAIASKESFLSTVGKVLVSSASQNEDVQGDMLKLTLCVKGLVVSPFPSGGMIIHHAFL